MKVNKLLSHLAGVVVLFLCFLAIPSEARAADLKLEARLIWGTNDEKSPNAEHKPVEPALAKKLSKVFKWHNYFEVKRLTASVPLNETKSLKMSSKCDLEVKNLGKLRVEATLIGIGKAVSKNVQTLTPGENLVVAGNDKNDTAWFVVVRSVDAE